VYVMPTVTLGTVVQLALDRQVHANDELRAVCAMLQMMQLRLRRCSCVYHDPDILHGAVLLAGYGQELPAHGVAPD
jgi:hypothetical protein